MNTTQPIHALLRELHAALTLMDAWNPNRAQLEAAAAYAKKADDPGVTRAESAELLRIASEYLRRASLSNESATENVALGECRWMMTAALFEHTRARHLRHDSLPNFSRSPS